MERVYRPDQDILDELEVGMSVAEVVNLSTSEYAARLRRLNLSPQAAALVKCLRRRIKNRVASQNSRRRTADHIRALAEQLCAVRATKSDILSQRQLLMRERQAWADRLGRLTSHITETLRERGEATPLPEEATSLNPSDSGPVPRLTYAPRDNDKFTCDLHSLVARSIHHMYRYEYDKDPADNVLDFRKHGEPSQCESNGNFTDPSVEDNIKNEREEVAKALQLLAMTEPKTELRTNINVFHDGYLPKSEDFDLSENSNSKSHLKQNIYSQDETILKSESSFFNVERSFYDNEYDSVLGGKPKSEPVRVRAKCVQIECEREHTMQFNDESSERRRKRVRKERSEQKSCIVHTSDVQAIESEIKKYQEQRFIIADKLFYSEDYLKGEVLNLSLKTNEGERRHHGRKQQAPRRIKYAGIEEGMALDLKIKKSCE